MADTTFDRTCDRSNTVLNILMRSNILLKAIIYIFQTSLGMLILGKNWQIYKLISAPSPSTSWSKLRNWIARQILDIKTRWKVVLKAVITSFNMYPRTLGMVQNEWWKNIIRFASGCGNQVRICLESDLIPTPWCSISNNVLSSLILHHSQCSGVHFKASHHSF